MPDLEKLIIDGVQYDLPQGGGPVNPVWTSSDTHHGTNGFGHIATILAEPGGKAEIIVGGFVGIGDPQSASAFVSDIYPSLYTHMGVTGTLFTFGGNGIPISGENSVVTDKEGNKLYYSSTQTADDCIAVSATRDAYMTPFNNLRQYPITPLYATVIVNPVGSADFLVPKVRAFIPSPQVMTQQQIVDELIQGGYSVNPFYCYGAVVLN